jgi:hypothetical protein
MFDAYALLSQLFFWHIYWLGDLMAKKADIMRPIITKKIEYKKTV